MANKYSISAYLKQSFLAHPVGYAASTALSLLQMANNLVSPYLIVGMMSRLQSDDEEERSEFIPLLFAYTGSILLNKAIQVGRERILTPIGTEMSDVLAQEVLRTYHQGPYERFVNDASSPPVGNFGAVKDRAPRALVNVLHGKIIPTGVEMVGASAFISTQFGLFGAIVSSALLVHMGMLALGAPKVVQSQNNFVMELYNAFGFIIAQIGQYLNVNLYNSLEIELENFKEVQAKLDIALDKSIHTRNLAQFFQTAPIYSLAVIGVGCLAFYQPESFNAEDFLWVFFYLAQFYPNFEKLSEAVNTLLSEKEFFNKTLASFNGNIQSSNSPKPVLNITPETASITFEDVSLRYKDSKTFALQRFSIKIPPGKVVVIVGQSGAGKTSLLNFISGIATPTKVLKQGQPFCGKILIGEDDISNVDIRSLRKIVAVVPQKLVLQNCSLRDNVAYANPYAARKKIDEAIHMAGLSDVLGRFGDNPIGLDGAKLSGGERQRVAIARAFIQDALINLLDEPTSALDPKSTKEVSVQLSEFIEKTGRTTIVVTHSPLFLNYLKNVHEIIVLNNGRIIERGTKESLLQNAGSFFAKQYKVAVAQDDLDNTEMPTDFEDNVIAIEDHDKIEIELQTMTQERTTSSVRKSVINMEEDEGGIREPLLGAPAAAKKASYWSCPWW